MIGGNIPGRTRVMSTAIFDYVETSQWREANILAGGMVVFAFAVILVDDPDRKARSRGPAHDAADGIRAAFRRRASASFRSTRLSTRRRGASRRCLAPRAAARRRCCVASPACNALRTAFARSTARSGRIATERFCRPTSVPSATCFRKRACFRTCPCGATSCIGAPRGRADGVRTTLRDGDRLRRGRRSARRDAAARPVAAQSVRRRAPARRDRPRADVAAETAADGRAAVGARPHDEETRSCRSSNGCTTICRCRSSTSRTT